MMRKNLRKSSIALAVAAAGVGVVGLSTQAVAVQIGTDGLGEALIYPYYTTNNGYLTLVDVINTSAKTVAFKIRLRDAKNSRDCRDFNVVLSPHDVWVASIEEGEDGQPRIWTPDNSCTSPSLPNTVRNGKFVNLTSADFAGTRSDSDDESIDRCREGYVEIIEMGTSTGGVYATDALHDSDGVPPCELIPNDFNNAATIGAVKAEFREPENVLKGNFSLIRTQTGQGFSGVPTTLANFYSPLLGVDGASADDLVSTAGGLAPSLGDAAPAESFIPDVLTGSGILFDTWSGANGGADPVSAVLMRSSVINEWSTNPGFGSNTDWAVTFPTKRFYVDPDIAGATVAAPFTELFDENSNAKSCVEIGIQSWNREEKAETVQNGFSPFVPGQANELCYESNVITFNRTGGEGILDSKFAQNIDTANLGLFGWTRLDMTTSAQAQVGLTSTGPVVTTYKGLPVTGFAVINRSTGSQSTNYGGLFDHAYQRLVS
ncbi:MAG TPA: hypothetical protein ENJ32_02335 [Crenotrichaceae bacterium]|nr:hypothetical protein [Crenotrichaceae bacterium]